MTIVTPAALLDAINIQHGTTLAAGERYAIGEQGAYRVRDASGAAFVLKWSANGSALARLEGAQAITDRLREHGYPAPRYVALGRALGVVYALQEMLPGHPASQLTVEQLPKLLELNALQASQAFSSQNNWPQPIVDTVLVGADGFCVLDTMRTYSTATRELLDIVQTLARAGADTPRAGGDIVHFDWSAANILVDDGRVSGVIDWDGAGAGDRAFDLATLLFYSYNDEAMRVGLWRALLELAALPTIWLYLAHMMLRQTEWSARFHDRATVELWLQRSALMLRDRGKEPR